MGDIVETGNKVLSRYTIFSPIPTYYILEIFNSNSESIICIIIKKTLGYEYMYILYWKFNN